MRVLALDVGERRIGVALSDPLGIIAAPVTAIERTNLPSDIEAVLDMAAEHEVSEIVVGLPLSLSGRAGPQAGRVQTFVRHLSQHSAIPVVCVDERYSTVEAERRLRESGVQPSRDRKRLDAASAAVILQAHLDARRSAAGHEGPSS